jgi:hypothetical protein
MKIKVRDLIGTPLNWAVDIADGWKPTIASDDVGTYPYLMRADEYKNPKGNDQEAQHDSA